MSNLKMVTLEEKVSFNYDELTSELLTCPACLNVYNRTQNIPKSLICRHTLCSMCLESICDQPRSVRSGSFKCPICRGRVDIPWGGPSVFPTDFRLNQFLDLIDRQSREVVQKCSNHLSQELLFCETCETLFCSQCDNNSHGNLNSSNSRHIVIPSSFAAKKMSERLSGKVEKFITKLNKANESICSEMIKLDRNAHTIYDDITMAFTSIMSLVENWQQEVLASVKQVHQEKWKILENQLQKIVKEKAKIENEFKQKKFIGDTSELLIKTREITLKLISSSSLLEPKENSLIEYASIDQSTIKMLQEIIEGSGTIQTIEKSQEPHKPEEPQEPQESQKSIKSDGSANKRRKPCDGKLAVDDVE